MLTEDIVKGVRKELDAATIRARARTFKVPVRVLRQRQSREVDGKRLTGVI